MSARAGDRRRAIRGQRRHIAGCVENGYFSLLGAVKARILELIGRLVLDKSSFRVTDDYLH